jgi:16S rRNA (guanine966-N2)-methyltransferase
MLRIIAGEMGGRRIQAPPGDNTRPTQDRIREALFSILQNKIGGCRFLDLFAGSGANGLEAISRGARYVLFVERGKEALRVIRENIQALGMAERCEVRAGDFRSALIGTRERFDIVFMDPPYREEYAAEAMALLRAHDLLAKGGCVVVEHERQMPEIAGFSLADRRKYGRTLLSFYQWEENTDENLCVSGKL